MNPESETLRIDIKKIIRSQDNPVIRNLPGFVIAFIKWLIKEKEINRGLEKFGHLKNFEFLEAVIDYLDITIETYGTENIPWNKDLIFVGNHALGGPDFFALMHVLKDHYPKANHLTNDILMGITPLKELFVPVKIFGKNPPEYKQLYEERLREKGIPVTIFPSGEVARFRNGRWDDGLWRSGFVRFARKFNRSVIPFFIPTRNSRTFYAVHRIRTLLGIKANLELFLLPREMFKMRGKTIRIYFGEPISPGTFDDAKTIHEWSAEVKKIAYALPEKYGKI